MTHLRFRSFGRNASLGEVLAYVLPDLDRSRRRAIIEAGFVRIAGRVAVRGTLDCPPGSMIEIEAGDEKLGRVEDDPFRPDRLERDAPHRDWTAIVDELPFAGGAIGDARESGERCEFWRIDPIPESLPAGLMAVGLRAPEPVARDRLLTAMASAGLCVVGDLERGGLGVPGGPRCRAGLHGEGAGLAALVASDWPPAWPQDRAEPLDFIVSEQTARALAAGHPWVRPDASSDAAERFRPGTRVLLKGRNGSIIGAAHTEGAGPIAARVWGSGPGAFASFPSIEARVAMALARRSAALTPVAYAETDAFRLVHGEGDGLPGLFVDALGPLLRVVVRGGAALAYGERVLAALLEQCPVTPIGQPWSVLELVLARAPEAAGESKARFDRVRFRRGGLESMRAAGARIAEDTMIVRERGLQFEVDPGWHDPRAPRPGFGLFLDQRENRDRVAARSSAHPGCWLNLFAHTGAFSVALLAAGAQQVVSVDLSAPYLDRIDRNLRLNSPLDDGSLPKRHESVRKDARRYFESLSPETRFDGIVIDPPSAAAAGKRFWSVRQELEPLLRASLERLDAGGTLLVTQNLAGVSLELDRVIERIARRSHRAITSLDPAPAGFDHPALEGFAEGDPFEGWIVRLD